MSPLRRHVTDLRPWLICTGPDLSVRSSVSVAMSDGHQIDKLSRRRLRLQVWGIAQFDLLIDAGIVAAIPDGTWNLQCGNDDQADGA